MPKDDEISRGLALGISKLQTALMKYETGEIPRENVAKLLELQKALLKDIEDINELVESALRQPSRSGFSRAKFYTCDSPYLNRMDLSRSYRLVPPMKVKKSTAATASSKRRSPSEFLLSSLQLLENITNLQRLHKANSDESPAPTKG